MTYETAVRLSDLPLDPTQMDALTQKMRTPLALPYGLTLPNRLALAPLAGTSNVAFRRIALHYGVGLVVTELISARGLCYPGGLERARTYLAMDEGERVALQLFGAEPEDFRRALEILLNHATYGRTAMIDLNFGCPVPKVVNGGAGAALLKDPERALEIVTCAVETAKSYRKPVSVKLRTGWTVEEGPLEALLPALKKTGVALVTIHGRLRAQFYAGEADWGRLLSQAKVLKSEDCPSTPAVFGNGDISTRSEALAALASPAIDGVMIGRAAMGAPWLFAELLGQRSPDAQEKKEVIRMHFEALAELLGEAVAAREFRSNLIAYLKGFCEARAFRREASAVASRSDLCRFLSKLPNF